MKELNLKESNQEGRIMKKIVFGLLGVVVGVILFSLYNGRQVEAQRAQWDYYPYHAATSADASSGMTVWATQTLERFTIENLIVSSGSAMAVQIFDGDTYVHTYYFNPNAGACPIYKMRSIAQGNDLIVKTEAAGTISVVVTGPSIWF